MLFLTFTAGLYSETYTRNSEGWTPENPFSGDTWVINEGDTVIFDYPDTAVVLSGAIENNGTLTGNAAELVFAKEYKQSSGELQLCGTTKFFADADLSNTTITFTDDTENHILYLYKTTTTSDSSYINIKTPSASPLEMTTIYMGGNVNLTLNNALGCKNFYVVNGTTAGADYAATTNWAANIISSNSASYGLTVSNEFDINRFSATDGVLGYINLQTPFTFGGNALKIHIGTQLTVEENQTFSADKVWISSYSSDLLTSFIVKGTANINTELNLGAESNPCAGKLIVEESGQLTVPHIFWTQETYKITDDTEPFTNDGTINVTTGISVITKDSNGTELPLINNGTINTSGASSLISAAYFLGSGSINMAGGSITATSTTKSSSIGSLTLTDSAEISVLNINFQNFIFENAGGKSISFTSPTGICNQTVSNKLILSGSSESSLLSLTGDSLWNLDLSSIANKSTNQITEYLNITNATVSEETPAYLSTDGGNNSNWIFDIEYIWNGSTSSSWEEASNWTPSTVYYPNNERYSVLIPDGCSKYPETTSSYTIKALTIGTSTATSHDSSITLEAANLVLADSDGLTNYSDLIFTSTGRIADSLGNLLIDSSQGRVIYKSGSGSITAYDDGYYNLKIESGSWNNSESINVGGTFTNTATFTLNEELTVAGAFTNQSSLTIESGAPLTIKGDLVNSGSISQSDSVYCKGACKNVTDTGSWTFSASAYIYFDADNSITFKSSSTSNQYNFDTSAASANTSFTGTSSGGQFLINSYRDGGQDLASFTNARFLNTANYTKPLTVNKVTFDASNSFTSLNATGDVTFSASNSFENLNADGNFSITFPAGTAYSQSVTSSLTLKGTSTTSLLSLKSSSASSSAESDCFYINYTGSLSDCSIQYVNLINAYNQRVNGTNHENITLTNSTDSGNNHYWDFPGSTYSWTGNEDTEWTNKNNWTPASVPGKGSLITIPSGRSIYPLLSTTSGDIDIYYSTTYKGSLTIAASASMDFASYSFTAGTITNNGTIRVKGASGQSLTAASKTNGANSTFAYYSSSIAEDVWANQYNYLTFIEDSDGTISTALSVNKTTTINTSGSLSLSGSNTFTGNLILTAGEDITLNAASAFTITANTGSTTQCENLTVNSDVKLAGNLITESSMIFNQNLTLLANAELQTSSSTGLITFVKNAGDSTATNSAYTLTIDSNLYFAQNAKANPSLLQLSSDSAITISSQNNSQINFACKLSLAEGSTATLSSPAKVSGDFTNAGTFNAESRLDLYADSANSGSIVQTDEIYFNEGVSSVSDSGTWTIDDDSYIHFANTSAELTFTSTSSANEYRFDTSSAGQPVNFEGSSASSKMIISAYRDSYSSSSACDGCTFTKVNVSQGQTFTKDLIAIDAVLFSGANTFAGLTLKGNVEFNASDSFTSLTANGLGGKTIIFPAGTTYSQTVTGSLTLKGTSTTSLLTLKSSSSSNDTAADCFYINFTGSLDNASLQYLNLKNAYNARMDGSSHENMTTKNSWDLGNNYYWNFLNALYTWTGDADTEWTNKNNWSPASIPGKGSLVTIPSGKTNYPLLTSTINILYDEDTYPGRLTIDASASMDFASYSFTAGTITNNGTIRAMGVAAQTLTAEDKINGANSTFAYYSSSIEKNVWDTDYNYLTFIEDAEGTISDALTVAKTTTIDTSGSISLSGANTFTGNLILTAGEDITLNAASAFTIAANTGSTAQCENLTINSDVTLSGNLITQTSMTFYQNLNLGANTTLQTIDNSGLITFVKNAGDATATNSTYTLTIDSNLYFGRNAKANPSYLLLANTKDISISAAETAVIAADLFIDTSNEVTFASSVNVENFYFYNGALTLDSGITLTCHKDFVTFGSNYNADDENYSGSDTRFAYYPQTQSGAIAYTLSNPLNGSSYSASFSSLSGAVIKTEGNLYINGSDLYGGDSLCTIIIPDNTSSNPVFNYGSSPTEDMWGLPYAVIFNSTISNMKIEDGNGDESKSYLTASESLTDAANMGNSNGGNNSNIQFDYPRIVSAKTVYDDVIYLAFNMPLENSNGEINTNLQIAASNKEQGGIWYNSQSLQLISKAYTDAECTSELSETADLTTQDSDDYYGFYIRTQNEKWNTDASGSASTSELAISKNTKDDSCDSNGVHHDITVDLYYFEGLFTAAQGHTMALNQHYDQTEDKCAPVMLQVSTGREAHTDYSGSGSQALYDAHNFIELRYSEAVDIGSLDAADSDDDGNNNLQASESFGHITQNSTNEGLTIAGLITTSDGSLTAFNKKDDSSPHALYRTFPVDSSSETKLQTHRIRIGIAAYVDEANPVSFDSKEFNNWLGYIESASAPAGSASLISENAVEIKDVNSNPLQRSSKDNHTITTSGMAISSYSDWDCIAPDFTLCWKRDEDQAADYFEILGTGSGSTIDRLEMHISDNQNTDDVFWATGYGWVYKESREWVDADSSYSADIIGGIRLSSIYDQYEKFKYGIGENSTPSLLFTGINPGASSSFFTGYRNEKTHNIPTTMDNPYFTFDVPSSDLTFDTEFTISYDETDSYITDLAGNRLHSRQMSSIDRTPPKINICLASVGNNLLSIIFTKEIADSFTYTTNSGANNSGNLTDFLPYAIKIGSISGGIWTAGSDLEIDTSFAAIKDQNHSNSNFTTYTFHLNKNVTLEDIKTLSLRIESPNATIDGITFEETAKDNFTGLTGSKVTILQDYLGNYIQMYSAHALSDFAINSINPLYAYDPDFVSDGESLSIFEGLYSDSEPQSHAVHDWSQNQTNFGTLPYGDDIVLIADTTDGDDNSNIPDFRMYLSARPVTNSTSNQYNTDLDENKRVWQPELDGYTYFNNLATLPNTVFDSLDKTSSPDFDTSDSAFENAVQYNIDVSELNNEWQNKDQVSFIFGLNNGSNPVTIVHSPEYLPETDNYDCHNSPLFALRLTEASNLLSFDLWSFRLNKISLQRGGVTILNNVINLTNNEKTVLKVNMASQGKLKVIVMTLDGNIIKYLENTNSTSGEHTYTWDGTNLNGKKVARGLYFIRVIGDDFDETRKVMCVK